MTRERPDRYLPQRLFMHLFPAGDDLTLIVLKGHLLIEEQLNARLQDITRKPEALLEARLRFHSLSKVCKALFYGENSAREWFWSAMSRLNAIRNHLAHHLETPQLETKIDDMLRGLEQDVPFGIFESSGSRADRTRQALAFLYGVVQGMRTRQDATQGLKQMPGARGVPNASSRPRTSAAEA